MKYIQTNKPGIAKAIIFSDEQRETINSLLKEGYCPDHTAVGVGLSTDKHWNLIAYKGRYGVGYKMITSSPYSKNFKHITYFVKAS